MIRPLEPAEETEPRSSEVLARTREIFARGGSLEEALGLEHRPHQEVMAERFATALERERPLLFEAGTGVGKSLAYLLPGLLHAVATGRPFLVSTHTISLQEQIREKDLAQCRALFQAVPALQGYANFRAAFLVGRGNYVCAKRLARVREEQGELFPSSTEETIRQLLAWAAATPTGLRQELDFPVPAELWDAVNADASSCNRKECPAENCFFHAARDRVRKAHVIILNHSLLFSLVAAGMTPGKDETGVLFAGDFLMLDEAHTLPAIATDHLGSSLSSYGLERGLRILYNPKTQKGILRKRGRPADLRLVEEALAACGEFFEATAALFLRERDQVRLLEPDWAEPVFREPLRELSRRLKALAEEATDETRHAEMRDQQARIDHYRGLFDRFLALDFEGHVIWVERGGRRRPITTLRSAPIDLAPELRAILFAAGTTVGLTSATLAPGEDMDPFLRRIGAEGQEHGRVDSPFPYEENTRALVSEDCPAATGRTPAATLDYWAEAILAAAGAVRGGTLVLFTSHQDLATTARRVQPEWEAAGRLFLRQGGDLNRSTLLERFREDGNGLLFGTDSFWTGIDVPGPALSQVIVTKLPFENPSHPVHQAREEAVRERGGSPFTEISLPDALLKFRQGLGRLVRRVDDRGQFVLLDARLLRKPYGRAFLAALPVSGFGRFRREDWPACFAPGYPPSAR
jgi:ATP-dependent DNA helicase DinG